MKESMNLIGGLLSYVCQHDLFKCVQILHVNLTCQRCDMKSSNGWMVMFLCNSNSWTQIVQVPVFRQISLICQKNFGKPKLIAPISDPPLGFQRQGSSLVCTIACLCIVNLSITFDATCAFSTVCVYTYKEACLSDITCRHWMEDSNRLLTWTTLGFDLEMPSLQANMLSSRPRQSGFDHSAHQLNVDLK